MADDTPKEKPWPDGARWPDQMLDDIASEIDTLYREEVGYRIEKVIDEAEKKADALLERHRNRVLSLADEYEQAVLDAGEFTVWFNAKGLVISTHSDSQRLFTYAELERFLPVPLLDPSDKKMGAGIKKGLERLLRAIAKAEETNHGR